MGVDVAHLVPEASRDADDQVVDDGLDGPKGGHILACAVVEFDVDDVLGGMREADGKVRQVLDQLAWTMFRLRFPHVYCCALNVPLGPSTVTILDLMCTLTVLGTSVSKILNLASLFERVSIGPRFGSPASGRSTR